MNPGSFFPTAPPTAVHHIPSSGNDAATGKMPSTPGATASGLPPSPRGNTCATTGGNGGKSSSSPVASSGVECYSSRPVTHPSFWNLPSSSSGAAEGVGSGGVGGGGSQCSAAATSVGGFTPAGYYCYDAARDAERKLKQFWNPAAGACELAAAAAAATGGPGAEAAAASAYSPFVHHAATHQPAWPYHHYAAQQAYDRSFHSAFPPAAYHHPAVSADMPSSHFGNGKK